MGVARPRVGVAVLTTGDRMPELRALLDSVAAQDEPAARIVVVGNGCALPGLPDGVVGVELAENLGVSGGRNVAWRRLREYGDVDVLVDLDDDGLLVDTDVVRRTADLYETRPGARLGIVGFRIADEAGGTQRRHVPRLRAADPSGGAWSRRSSAAPTPCRWRCWNRRAAGRTRSSSPTS